MSRPVLNCFCVFATGVAGAIGVAGSAGAVTIAENPVTPAIAQGQLFYGPHISQIATERRNMCMVATGSDWKRTAEARSSREVDRLLSEGLAFETAFMRAQSVDLAGLASNTPFAAFTIGADGPEKFRIAAGFIMRLETAALKLNGLLLDDLKFELEPRGDALVVTDPEQVAMLFDAYQKQSRFDFRASSSKQLKSSEHYVRYQFFGGYDAEALEKCQQALRDAPLRTSLVPSFTLKQGDEISAAERARLEGMACNREIDLEGAHVVELDGPITGLATPLRHALLQRDEDGQVTDIVSGDLWWLHRGSSGYELRVSRSIATQSPMDVQSEKACTRYAEPSCAVLSGDPLDGMQMGECVGMLTSAADAMPVGIGVVAPPVGPVVPGSGPPPSSRDPDGPPGGTPPGGTPPTVTPPGGTPPTTGTPPTGTPPTVTPPYIPPSDPNPPDNPPDGPDGGDPPQVVPLPPSALMLIMACLAAWALRARRGFALVRSSDKA